MAGLRLCQRGDLGQIGIRFLERDDRLVDLQADGATVVGTRVVGGSGSLRFLAADLAVEEADGTGNTLGLPDGTELAGLVPLGTP
jgi:DNA gyrase subunit A